jgi:hypothetical protein
VYVVFGVVLAFAFTFPLFLLLRERAVLATGSSRLTTRRNLPAP